MKSAKLNLGIGLLAMSLTMIGAEKLKPLLPALIEEKVTVDGELKEGFWKNALTVKLEKNILPPSANNKATPTSTIRLARSKDALLIGLECEKSSSKATAIEASSSDKLAVLRNDNVEFVLDPGGEEEKLFFALNSNGARYDRQGLDLNWNPEWTSAVKKGSERWTAEIVIPFAPLGGAKQTLFMTNFLRNLYDENGDFQGSVMLVEAPYNQGSVPLVTGPAPAKAFLKQVEELLKELGPFKNHAASQDAAMVGKWSKLTEKLKKQAAAGTTLSPEEAAELLDIVNVDEEGKNAIAKRAILNLILGAPGKTSDR